MRLLRLTNSNDTHPSITAGESKVGLCDDLLADATGEPIETTVRAIWPNPNLPDLIEDWLGRYQPDLVFLTVSSYWITYRSVPLRVERSWGPLGPRLSKAGKWAAGKPRLAHNGPFRAARKVTLGAIGGAPFFEPEQVIDRMEICIRRILAHEGSAALAVRGPRVPFAPEGSERAKAWAEERRQRTHRGIAAICERVHVPYQGWDESLSAQDRADEFLGDLVHASAEDHERLSREEAEILLEAWRQHARR